MIRQWFAVCGNQLIGGRLRLKRALSSFFYTVMKTNNPNQNTEGIIDSKQIIAQLTELATTSHIFKTMTDTREIYRYKSDLGIYVNDGESLIEELCESEYGHILTSQVNEVKNHIRRRTLIDRNEFNRQVEWLTCRDCVVNLKTLETRLHSPEFMATISIPWSYDLSSSITHFFALVEGVASSPPLAPGIIKFMHQVMSDDDVETVLDFIAYCLWRGFPFHKYLVVVKESCHSFIIFCTGGIRSNKVFQYNATRSNLIRV